MADVTVGAKLSLDSGDARQSLREFKQEIKAAQGELLILAEKFGPTSKEALNAANKIAALKDKIKEVNEVSELFNPEKKFIAVTNAVRGLAGGFSALQGSMALLGVQSEDVQKTILKVQGAMALMEGLSVVADSAKDWARLSAIIQQTTIFQKVNNAATVTAATVQRIFGASVIGTGTAFNILKAAIISTGIGLLIVGLGEAANALGLFADKTQDAADAQKQLDSILKYVNEDLAKQLHTLDREKDLAVARAKARGASEKEIFDIEQSYRRQSYERKAAYYEDISGLDKEAAAKAAEDLKDANAAGQIAQLNYDADTRRKREDAAKRAAEEAARKEQHSGIKFGTDPLLTSTQIAERDAENDAKIKADAEKRAESHYDNLSGLFKGYVENTASLDIQRTTDEHNLTAQRILDAEEERAAKVTAAQSIGNALGSLANLVGQQTAAGKVLGIAQATINTFIGASEVLRAKSTLPEPFGTISKIANVTAIIATGLSAVKNIAKVQVPGAGGGSVSGASVDAPLQPTAPAATNTVLNQNQLNQLGNAAVRAFVVESDVTNNQERITRLNRAARIG